MSSIDVTEPHRRGRLRRVLRRARRARPAGALEPAAQDHAGRADPEHPAVAVEVGHDLPARARAPARSSRSSAAATAACSRSRTRASTGCPFTSTTLWGAIQYLGPGETAPAHRHTPSAIRFVMTGSGVYTTVDGDACEMEPGDLILTPELDVARPQQLRRRADGVVRRARPAADGQPRVDLLREPPATCSSPCAGTASPSSSTPAPGSRPPARSATRSTRRCSATPGATPSASSTSCSPRAAGHEATVEYLNPATGGPAIRTFSCEMTRLVPGARTPTRRATGSAVHVVFHGRGPHGDRRHCRSSGGPGDIFVDRRRGRRPTTRRTSRPTSSCSATGRCWRRSGSSRRRLPEQQAVAGVFSPR